MKSFLSRIVNAFGRIGVRLLIVNLVVLLVPVAGLEFARIYERQLLESLERDMRNQSAVLRATLEREPGSAEELRVRLSEYESVIEQSARSTRTRVRLLDAAGKVVADSHRQGPPEGAEPPAPSIFPGDASSSRRPDGPPWPEVPNRKEVRGALAGVLATTTRVRGKAPAVLLFMAEPITGPGGVLGVIYVTRSTQPVIVELHRIRAGLRDVLLVALLLTSAVTLLLAYSITRPVVKLSGAARRVASGELHVAIPVLGSGELRELGEAFRAMKERLLQRLRFAREFSADVAHELKSPLTGIRGAAELLESGADDDPEARARFLKNILLDVERLDALVNHLLELGRVEASELPMAPVDLHQLVTRVAERLDPEQGRTLVSLAAEPPIVTGREADLETALVNLLDNALRASPSEERVTIEISHDDGHARVWIADQGPGISEANRKKIFDRFFTTHGESGGTGLGLAIVKSVAEAHGGRVWCESQAKPGTRFCLELPG